MELTFASFLGAADAGPAPAAAAEPPRFVDREHRAWLAPGIKRRFVPRWHGAAAFGAMLIVGGLLLIGGGAWTWRWQVRENARFRDEGADASCEVVSRHIDQHRKGVSYIVTCDHVVDARRIQRRVAVSELRFRDLPRGATIAIRYLRSDPTRFRMLGPTYDPTDTLLMSALFGIGAAMVGGAFLEHGLKRRRVERRLERDGIVLPGRVVESRVVKHESDRAPTYYSISVTYRFTCPCGEEITAHETVERQHQIAALPADAPLCIAFADPRCHSVL